MKKKLYLPLIIFLIIAVILILFIFNNRTIATIYIDVNPSIQINLKKNNQVKNIIPINDDAKSIIKDLQNNSLEDTLKEITNNIIKYNYLKDNQVFILISTKGNVNKDEVIHTLSNDFGNNNIHAEIVSIDKITNEDKETAKKYHISESKAAYLNSIKENTNIDIQNLINKPISELEDTKLRGRYCKDGYTLEGDFCLKEIKRESALTGDICPNGYYEHNHKCYEESPIQEKENLICPNEFTLKDNNCVRILTFHAEPNKYSCSKGEAKTKLEMDLTKADSGDANDIICVDLSSATHPVSPCELPKNDPTERIQVGGKCYWHRAPVLSNGCPGKLKVAGECWDDASNILICAGYRDGKQYKSKNEYCEHSIKYYEPTITEYKCPENHTLNGNKCEINEYATPYHERYCLDGFTLINDEKCLNLNKTTNKQNGYYCQEENSKLDNNTCIIYEIIEANIIK